MADRTVVALVGAGHANLHLAARAREFADRGARVVLIDPGRFWYSGLATGMLGGAVDAEADTLDPSALIEASGGEFLPGRVTEIDPARRVLRLADGERLAFDLLCLNVGSEVKLPIPGLADVPGVWPVKPISNLWALRRTLEARFHAGESPAVAVVGGGATGCEIAANLHGLAVRRGARARIHLVTHGPRLLSGAPAPAAAALERALRRRGIQIRKHAEPARYEPGRLTLADGAELAADLLVVATGLQPNPLVQAIGLPAEPGKGLTVNACLHSPANVRLFAAGDCAHLQGHELPNLGVFGVREAAVVRRNLLASLAGEPLAAYRPQRRYLSILNLGDGTGLATWGRLWWRGRASLLLKNRIDHRFLAGYRATLGASIA